MATIIGTDKDDDSTLLGSIFSGHGHYLLGTDEDDDMFGLAGNDLMLGGDGDDTYIVDNAGDQTFEIDVTVNDRVITFVSFTLSEGVERLTLAATAGAINGTGNELDNLLEGNDFATTLDGRDGEDVTSNLRTIADTLGIDKMAVVGLSGGGPYTLACAAAMPERVVAAGVVGGVAPTTGGDDSIGGGLMGNLGVRVAPLLEVAKVPIGMVATTLVRLIRPVAGPAADLYGLVSPPGDRALMARPEIKAMFLDDLLNGSRKQLAAPFYDIIAFARDWGFRLDEVKVHVRWWHGDADHIVPYAHGEHVVSRLPDAELYPMPGESHLGGLGRAEEILRSMLELWDSAGTH